jgi:hypothetical protein
MQYEVQLERVIESQPLAVVRLRARQQDLSKVVPLAPLRFGHHWKLPPITGSSKSPGDFSAGRLKWDAAMNLIRSSENCLRRLYAN